MEIGILTYYGVHNHGAVLQANALKNVLEAKGHKCGFLEFERDYSNISQKQANKYKLNLGSIPFYVGYLMEKGFGNILYNIRKRKTLGNFRAENLPLISKWDEFAGDLAVIGSDEVFSLEIGVNPFLYGNNLKAKHVVSYAGCFGTTTYDDVVKQGYQTMIADGIKHMDAISVRDGNSLEIVREITGIDATMVCDPVILYGYEKEMHTYIPTMKDYVLIYSYDKNLNDPDEYKFIKKYAQQHNLKLVSVGYYHPWCKSIDASPIELLGWIKNASLVVTDTFHGSVLSIICNTPLVVKFRDNQNKLKFLLSEYNLEDRIIADFSEMERVAATNMDFDTVNAIVKKRRSASMEFLDNVLSVKTEEPTVSVVIPVYNVKKYIEKCVLSVLEQTYKCNEIIVIDDGSTDQTPEILDAIASQNVCVKVIHKKNAGVSAARNDGIEMSNGEYIVFVDGDDYLAPDFCQLHDRTG